MTKRRVTDEAARIDRRAALQLGAGFAVLAAGCGSSDSPPAPPGGEVVPAQADAASPPPSGTAQPPAGPPDAGSAPVDSGVDAAVATESELLAGIETIIVVMMENRSFDHYLGRLKSDLAYPGAGKVDGLVGSESNPDEQGVPVPVFRMDDYTPADPRHDWDPCHAQWNHGKNDGFVTQHAGASSHEVMGGHDRTQIPFMYWLADTFTVCDAWFASVMGPTWPNRYYLHATSSAGEKGNSPFATQKIPTIWERMKDKGHTAKNYYAGGIGWFAGAFASKLFGGVNPLKKMDEFFADAKGGTLPNFAVIDPDFTANDDHPSHSILKGQAFLASVYNALAQSPQWGKCLLVITYDEHGGFYDHVAPPTCSDALADFQQLGFRVPTIIAGPTVRRGYVLKTQLEHASVAATLATRFGIASLSLRMDGASTFAGAIDPTLVGQTTGAAPIPPPVSFSSREEWYAAEPVSSQPELEAALRSGRIPASAYDPRSRTERLQSWTRHAERLGAVATAARVE